MEVKEAIEFIEDEKLIICGRATQCPEAKGFNEVVALLKRGEKFEATMMEITKIADKDIFPYANDGERLKYILEEIAIMKKGGKQKYFSKEAKQDNPESKE